MHLECADKVEEKLYALGERPIDPKEHAESQ